MHSHRAWTIGLVLATTLAAPQIGAQVLRARVTDAVSQAPVTDAVITIVGDEAHGSTNEEGKSIVKLRRAGANIFLVRRIGYVQLSATLEVPDHDTLNVHFVMQPSPPVLDSVVSTASVPAALHVSDFESRRAKNAGGAFITRDEIVHEAPIRTTDLFRRVHGVQVREKNMTRVVVSSRGPISAVVTPDMCVLPIGRDGLVLGPDYNLDDIPVNEIYGIEIYDGPSTIPVEFRSSLPNGSCGLIMIWTRSGAGSGATRAPSTDTSAARHR